MSDQVIEYFSDNDVLTVGELKELIQNLPDDAEVYGQGDVNRRLVYYKEHKELIIG